MDQEPCPRSDKVADSRMEGTPETYLLTDNKGQTAKNQQSNLPDAASWVDPTESAPNPPPRVTPLLALVTFLAGLGGFLFGYDTGVISGALLLLKTEFQLSVPWQEGIVASTTAAAALFALVGGGWAVRSIGRRKTILGASLVFIVGSVVLAAAVGTKTLLVGRLIVGAAIGLASVTVPVYIAECSPAHIRGTLVFLFQVNITVGMFLSVVVDGLLSYDRQNGWRYMFGVAAIPGLAQLIGVLFMPSSPRWLVSAGHTDQALKALRGLRGQEDVQEELNHIIAAHKEEQEAVGEQGQSSVFLRMLKDRPVRRALLVGCGLQMFQQLVGINTVMYYSATIILMAGFTNDSEAIWWAAGTAGVNVLFTFVGICLVDRIGRRLLLLLSLTGVLFSLILLAVGFLVTGNTSPPITPNYRSNYTEGLKCSSYSWCNDCVDDLHCGFCYLDLPSGPANGSCMAALPPSAAQAVGVPEGLACRAGTGGPRVWSYDVCPGPYGWVVVLAMALYLVSFAIGMGPIPWTLNSEIYPLWARGTGCALATATNWTFNLLISMTFLSLADLLTKPGVFLLYSGLTVLSVIFTYMCVPETKGQSLENIQRLFDNRWAYQPL